MSLHILPEELLERILAHVLLFTSPRPAWLRSPTHLAPLCVSRQFNRIATPLLYHTVHLPTPRSAHLLLKTLTARPEYAQHIRDLTVLAVWHPVVDVLPLCRGLSRLDLTIAFDEEAPVDVDVDAFANLTEIRHLSLRKPTNVYLSLARPRALINALAHAITTWSHLHTADIAFKLSDDTPTSPIIAPFSRTPQPACGPITSLSTALALSPSLHTFSTHLPSVWNTSIATIASNPALHRISLSPPTGPAAIPGTGLFLMEARRHPRLAELIAAGTPIIRSRAHTLGTRLPPPAAEPHHTTKPSIGLGLRIDTSAEVVNGGVYSSPGAASAGASAINPAWMGPVRASPGAKAKGRARG